MKREGAVRHDRHEDRSLRQEKLASPAETLPAKTLKDRAERRRKPPKSREFRHIIVDGGGAGRGERIHQGDEVPTTFAVEAPDAKSVTLAGTFNDWDPAAMPMVREQSGTWVLHTFLKRGQHEYRFVVDGTWCDDPNATETVPNPFGSRNSVVRP